jgi:hypothetical protein
MAPVWFMQKNSWLMFAVIVLSFSTAYPQVLAPVEIKDPELRGLQQQYLDDLKALGEDVRSLQPDYPFYLSRKLDLNEQQQKAADQRSIRFDHYKGKTVLEITGNYYAAYSADKMTPERRAKKTFDDIVMPLLKTAVPRFQRNKDVKAYAFEISHHVIGKAMGVTMERPENLVVVIPQQAAIRLLGATDENVQQAALLQAEIYLNGDPVTLWLKGEGPQLAAETRSSDAPPPASASVEVVHQGHQDRQEDKAASEVTVASAAPAKPVKPADPPAPVRDTSPQTLASLQAANKETLSAIVKELDAQAHFVPYAAPGFIAFRKGIYLEFSINTTLSELPGGSRYRQAALAFDDHIAHLIRPLLGYVKDDSQFDGVSFSTTLHLAGKTAAPASGEAVEFFFPLPALRCYERYDCTGQQLIDAGTVLINGERVGLDLQIAEGGTSR